MGSATTCTRISTTRLAACHALTRSSRGSDDAVRDRVALPFSSVTAAWAASAASSVSGSPSSAQFTRSPSTGSPRPSSRSTESGTSDATFTVSSSSPSMTRMKVGSSGVSTGGTGRPASSKTIVRPGSSGT